VDRGRNYVPSDIYIRACDGGRGSLDLIFIALVDYGCSVGGGGKVRDGVYKST
jgi:hypothetical protein